LRRTISTFVFTAVLVALIPASGAFAGHTTHVAWTANYPMGVLCHPGETVRVRARVIIESEDAFDDFVASDRKLHTFIKDFPNSPVVGFHAHWDAEEARIVRQRATSGSWSVVYMFDYPYDKIRLNSMWVKYGNPDLPQNEVQIVEIKCANAVRFPMFQNSVNQTH